MHQALWSLWGLNGCGGGITPQRRTADQRAMEAGEKRIQQSDRMNVHLEVCVHVGRAGVGFLSIYFYISNGSIIRFFVHLIVVKFPDSPRCCTISSSSQCSFFYLLYSPAPWSRKSTTMDRKHVPYMPTEARLMTSQIFSMHSRNVVMAAP